MRRKGVTWIVYKGDIGEWMMPSRKEKMDHADEMVADTCSCRDGYGWMAWQRCWLADNIEETTLVGWHQRYNHG